MNREDAYYFKILLASGFYDGYEEWLNGYLEAQNPLSDIVLNLSLCGSDTNKTISCLHAYCMEQPFNEKYVCEKLRLFLKEGYSSGRFSKEDIISYMYCFATAHGDSSDFEMALWGSMYYMDYYHSLAKEGIVQWERFDFAFFSYLNHDTPVDVDRLWNRQKRVRSSLLKRIIRVFMKKE